MTGTARASESYDADNDKDTRPAMLLIAGFGDNGSMFANLSQTSLADTHRLLPLDLPGFGAPALDTDTTLDALAMFVAAEAQRTGAEIVVAHSVASIIASIAARKPGCPLNTIVSLEGNITAEDAYFSGSAADYDSPGAFRQAFLGRLDEMAASTPIIARYREAVSHADPQALWQLGKDARQFSVTHVPGHVLAEAGAVTYIYNPANCPDATLSWLDQNPMDRIILESASRWPTVDQPEIVAEKISIALH